MLKRKNNLQLLIGFSIIIFSVIIVFSKYYPLLMNEKKEKNEIKKFYEVQKEIKKEEDNQINVQNVYINKNEESYIGVLKIENIDFEKGFYDFNSTYNAINKNIQVLSDSDMPNIENGNLIIAAHSGNGTIAFFKNLFKLNIGDEAQIIYNGKTYIYELSDIYEIEKTGKAIINRNENITTLTLITCKYNTNKQIVFIFNLKNIN